MRLADAWQALNVAVHTTCASWPQDAPAAMAGNMHVYGRKTISLGTR